MQIFYTENKQTEQLIFSFLVTLIKKRKTKNGMNRTLTYFEQIGWKQKICEFIKPFREQLILKVKE